MRPKAIETFGRPKVPVHPYLELVEALAEHPTFVHRPMFGCRACYYRGLLVLVLAAKEDPWRGVLVPTEREHQPSLISDRPALRPHPVLPKWLYLPEKADSFESDTAWLIHRIQSGDPRIGVVPNTRKRKLKPKTQTKKTSARKSPRQSN